MSTPFKAELVCVDPKLVGQFWPHVKDMLLGAIRRVDLNRADDIEAEILEEYSLLWLAWDGKAIEAAAITKLTETDNGKVCVLVSCAGQNRSRWVHFIKQLEQYATDEGCRSLRIYGREGWLRVLPDYKQIAVVIEKGLP